MSSDTVLGFFAGCIFTMILTWVARRTVRFDHHFTMRIEQGMPDDPADYWKQDED